MMWKDSYKIGVDIVDEQHFELFNMVENLLKAFEMDRNWKDKQKSIEAIEFMKNYVVKHFEDEEKYQRSIGYMDIENHIKEHRQFTQTVLDYEKKFIDTDYDIKLVKQFAGKLVSWLIYHVADSDQKIVNHVDKSEVEFLTYAECIVNSLSQVFKLMFDIDIIDSEKIAILKPSSDGDIFSKVTFIGDRGFDSIFVFPKDIALHLIKIMTGMDILDMDEFVCSAIAEISNIVSGNAATELTAKNILCDIKPPVVTIGEQEDIYTENIAKGISIATEIGKFSVLIHQ